MLKDYIVLIRLPNSIMSGLGVVFTIIAFKKYVLEAPGDYWLLVTGFFTGFLATAASMIYNDVVDAPVDMVNKPWRPIPSGRVTPRRALILSAAMALLAVAINAPRPVLAAVTALYTALGIGYSRTRGRWWSQLLVATSTTGPVVYGSLCAESVHSPRFATMFAITIFVVTLGREVLKAIQDIEGDKRYGYETIPIRFGVENAYKTLVVAGVTGPILGLLAGLMPGPGAWYLALIAIAGALYGYSALEAYFSRTREVLEKSRKRMLAGMMIGLLALWLSGL